MLMLVLCRGVRVTYCFACYSVATSVTTTTTTMATTHGGDEKENNEDKKKGKRNRVVAVAEEDEEKGEEVANTITKVQFAGDGVVTERKPFATFKKLKTGDIVTVVIEVGDPAAFRVKAKGWASYQTVVETTTTTATTTAAAAAAAVVEETTTATATTAVSGEKALPQELWVVIGSFLPPLVASRTLFTTCKALWRLWPEYLRYTYDIKYDAAMRSNIQQGIAVWVVSVAGKMSARARHSKDAANYSFLTMYEMVMCHCDMGKLVAQYLAEPSLPENRAANMIWASLRKPRSTAAAFAALRQRGVDWTRYYGALCHLSYDGLRTFDQWGGTFTCAADYFHPNLWSESYICDPHLEWMRTYGYALNSSIFVDQIKACVRAFTPEQTCKWFNVVINLNGIRPVVDAVLLLEIINTAAIALLESLHQLHAITVQSFSAPVIEHIRRFLQRPSWLTAQVMAPLFDIIGDLISERKLEGEPVDETSWRAGQTGGAQEQAMAETLTELRQTYLAVRWGAESEDGGNNDEWPDFNIPDQTDSSDDDE